MRSLVVTGPAREDLRGIARFIARDDRNAATRYVASLVARFERIRLRPHAYRMLPRFEALGIRRAVHGAHLVLFREEAERVVILRVLHGARELGDLLR